MFGRCGLYTPSSFNSQVESVRSMPDKSYKTANKDQYIRVDGVLGRAAGRIVGGRRQW